MFRAKRMVLPPVLRLPSSDSPGETRGRVIGLALTTPERFL